MSDFEYNNMEEMPQNTYQEVGRFLWDILRVVITALIIIIPIRVFLFQPFFVQGASMEPNFEDGEYLIVNEFGYKTTRVGIAGTELFTVNAFRDLERYDVVIFIPPRDGQKFFIKRVVGLPGETVEIRGGKVFVSNNGQEIPIDESAYLQSSVVTNAGGNFTQKLADDEYFVLGDNRSVSSDSRMWGPIKQEEIIGKVFLRAWPVTRFSVF